MRTTNEAYLISILQRLICDMLDYRFQDLALEPEASLVVGGAFYSELVKEKMLSLRSILLRLVKRRKHSMTY